MTDNGIPFYLVSKTHTTVLCGSNFKRVINPTKHLKNGKQFDIVTLCYTIEN